MLIQIIIKTTLGEFISSVIDIPEDDYDGFLEMSKMYHTSAFDMELESGGYIIIPPEIIQNSVMIIKKIN